MGVIGGPLAARILTTLSPTGATPMPDGVPKAYLGKSKLEVLFGSSIWKEISDKTVVDFGSGVGAEAVELAEHGARRVIGLDIRQRHIDQATALALEHRVSDRCTFMAQWDGREPVDVIVSLDSFEHFDDPAAILTIMRRMLQPSGCVLVCFGPTWYHPYGGHAFSVFPWAQCVFTEAALVRWRSSLPGKKPIRSFRESGLNHMTVKRFQQIVDESPFTFASFEAVPIRPLRWLANGLSREFTTSVVRARLVPR